jgi:hypothetical protein
MDRSKLDWSWMTQHMPKVVAMLQEKRAAGLGKHLNLCWRMGVVQRQPGWFFAAEGAVTLGTPAEWVLVDPTVVAMRQQFPETVVLTLKEVSDAQA